MNRDPVEVLEAQSKALAAQGRIDLAEPLLRRLIDLDSSQPRHHLNLGFSLIEAGRCDEAWVVFDRAPATSRVVPLYWLGRGIARLEEERYTEAIEEFVRARTLDPDLVTAHVLEARAWVACGDRLGAESAVDRIPDGTSLDTDDATQLAQVLAAIHRFDAAVVVVTRALEKAPGYVPLIILMAEMRERENRIDAGIKLLEGIPPGGLGLGGQLVKARLLGRSGKRQEAVMLLRQLAQRAERDRSPEFAAIHFEFGKWLDKEGQFAAAWQAFTEANRAERVLAQKRFPERTAAAAAGRVFRDRVDLDWRVTSVQHLHEPRPQTRCAPVFLVGFPRSGTTLLDSMFNAHPGFRVLEEEPLLEKALAGIGSEGDELAERVALLKEPQLEELRSRYWAEVERSGPLPPGIQVIDKNPFNLLRVHLILCLFPDARWLYAIRHPLDSVVSCFMLRVAFTEVTRGFYDVSDAAEIFRDVTTLWLNQRQRLGITCTDVRYEDLVRRPEPEMRRVLQCLGAAWDDSVMEFHALARQRWIGTPSYDQVTRPLYQDSIGRWRHYREYLDPAIRCLTPIMATLGYAEDIHAEVAGNA